jgi:CBS domain-containing protein
MRGSAYPVSDDIPVAPVIAPENSVMEAAQLMSELNVGSLRVCTGGEVVGTVTDRDITLGAAARGRAPRSMAVAEVMHWCEGDAPVRFSPISIADGDRARGAELGALGTWQAP